MVFSLAACGDSADKDEEITQETAQESEEETIGLVISDEDADDADLAGNDAAAIYISASSNGNGSTAPVFKPGAEPQPGQELKPGEEPEPDAGTQKPQSNTGTQSSAGSQQSQQPQPNSGTQPSQQAQQSQPSQQAQQSQPSQPGAGTQTSGGTQSGTGTQTVHTHNFKGGDCSTPATCSCGATGDYGSHNWVTNSIHHDATGHYESRTTTELVPVFTAKEGWYECTHHDCGLVFSGPNAYNDQNNHWIRTRHNIEYRGGGFETVYEEQTVTKDVWVEDTAAWDEKVTKCSICGARQ